MDWPTLHILLPTYNRPKILTETLYSLDRHLKYQGNIQYSIGNDGDSLEDWPVPRVGNGVRVFSNPTGSLGANLNRLIRSSEDLMMQMDDDHQLVMDYDISDCVEKLYVDETVGAVRLGIVAGHRYIVSCDEIRRPGLLHGKFWRIDWNSPELYVCSNRPHLKRIRFHELYGLYTPGLTLGQTEEAFCHQCHNIAHSGVSTLDVVIPIHLPTEEAWIHVGDSWQSKGF